MGQFRQGTFLRVGEGEGGQKVAGKPGEWWVFRVPGMERPLPGEVFEPDLAGGRKHEPVILEGVPRKHYHMNLHTGWSSHWRVATHAEATLWANSVSIQAVARVPAVFALTQKQAQLMQRGRQDGVLTAASSKILRVLELLNKEGQTREELWEQLDALQGPYPEGVHTSRTLIAEKSLGSILGQMYRAGLLCRVYNENAQEMYCLRFSLD